MLDDLVVLRTFQRILTLGSLSAAAQDLGVSLAVVSKRLRALETDTGTRLISRTTRKLSPTDEGRRLLEHVERVLDELDIAESHLASGMEGPIGLLRVSAPISFGRVHLVPVTADLVERYPRLDIELKLTDRLVDLVEDRIDVAVRIGEPRDSTALLRKLVDNNRILAASPSYLKKFGKPRDPTELKNHRFIRYDDSTTPWLLLGPNGRKVAIETPCRLRADSGDAVLDWALAGQGIVLKSSIDLVKEIETRSLERVLPDWQGPSAPVHALITATRHVPAKVRSFLDTLAAHLARNAMSNRANRALGKSTPRKRHAKST